MPEDFDPRHIEIGDNVFGEGNTESLLRFVRSIDPEWGRLYETYVLEMYGRQVLTTRERELCAVAALAALGHEPQLRAHLKAALRHAPLDEVREVLLQVSVYTGIPSTMNAIRLLNEVVDEEPA